MVFKKPKRPKSIKETKQPEKKDGKLVKWSTDLNYNTEYMQDLFDSDDLVIRKITFGRARQYRAAVCYFDGLVDRATIHRDILGALMLFSPPAGIDDELGITAVAEEIKEHAITIGEVTATDDVEQVLTSMMSGECGIIVDGAGMALFTNTRGWPARGVSSPENENVVRGPREGFVETLRFNTALIRRWLRDTDLRLKMHQLGNRTKTDIGVMYIDGIADEEIVKGVEERLKAVGEVDAVLSDAQIEEMVEDQFLTLFPTVETTQRPDKVASSLLEGRVAILVDRTPQIIIVPVTLPALLQAADDYYNRWPLALTFRLIRWLSLIVGMYLPALYVALASFNPELIPLDLLLSIAGSRSNIPFPVIVEILLLEIAIEILREASIRLPSPLGSTIGIVGGFVLGNAAVEAGIISPILVIIVATTALASYTIPNYGLSIAIRAVRFPLLFAAAIGGLYGVIIFTLLGLTHLCSLESFGISYMSSIAPYYPEDQKDVFMRLPYWSMIRRPDSYRPRNRNRQYAKKQNWWGQVVQKVVAGAQGQGKHKIGGKLSGKDNPDNN